MHTIEEKLAALIAAYQDEAKLDNTVNVLLNSIALQISNISKPLPPLKKVVEYTKTQLMIDMTDRNYLLCLSKHNKILTIAQRILQGDKALNKVIFNLMLAGDSLELVTQNSEAYLKTSMTALINKVALVSLEEEAAVIPKDETL